MKVDLGACRLGAPRRFGPQDVTFGIECEKGGAAMRLDDGAPRRIVAFEIVKDRTSPCDG